MKLLSKLLVLSYFFFNVSISLAQKVKMEWGPEFKDQSKVSLGDVIGEDEEYYYVLKKKSKGLFNGDVDYVFERYTQQHKFTKGHVLSTKNPQGKEGEFLAIYQLEDKFIMLFSYYDSKADMNLLYAVDVDKSGDQGKPVVVDKEPSKKEKKSGKYSFILSEDDSKLLVMRTAAYDKKGVEKFKYIMLKSNLENLWEKEIELPHKDKDFNIENYIIDEKGNVFLLGSYKLSKSDKYLQFKVFAYDYSKDKLEDIKINFNKAKYISNLKFTLLQECFTPAWILS